MPRRRRSLSWGVATTLVAGGVGLAAAVWLADPVPTLFGWLGASGWNPGALEKLDVYGRVPDFSLVERSGRTVTLSELQGKVWVANFFYTECTETCPLQAAHMARLQADMATEQDVRLVSITLDPEHDTPEVLSEYAGRFRAQPGRWLFLTGPKPAIYQLAVEGFRLGAVDSREPALRTASAWAHPFPNADRKPLIHSSRFALVDRQARIRGYYPGNDEGSLDRLRRNLRIVLREERA